jgi:four helix bundle protein
MSSLERFNFEKLRVYQDALDFSRQIYKTSKKFPKEEIFGVTSQLRRAALSIALNIAEGSGLAKVEFKNFLRRARASVHECVPILVMALDNSYILKEGYDGFYQTCQKSAKSISALIKSMK